MVKILGQFLKERDLDIHIRFRDGSKLILRPFRRGIAQFGGMGTGVSDMAKFSDAITKITWETVLKKEGRKPDYASLKRMRNLKKEEMR